MAYEHFKNLPKFIRSRTASDKVARDKAFDVGKNPKYYGYQRSLALLIYNFFDKKSVAHTGTRINSDAVSENQQLTNERHKAIIRKFKNRKILSSFRDNIRGADLADMHLLSQ